MNHKSDSPKPVSAISRPKTDGGKRWPGHVIGGVSALAALVAQLKGYNPYVLAAGILGLLVGELAFSLFRHAEKLVDDSEGRTKTFLRFVLLFIISVVAMVVIIWTILLTVIPFSCWRPPMAQILNVPTCQPSPSFTPTPSPIPIPTPTLMPDKFLSRDGPVFGRCVILPKGTLVGKFTIEADTSGLEDVDSKGASVGSLLNYTPHHVPLRSDEITTDSISYSVDVSLPREPTDASLRGYLKAMATAFVFESDVYILLPPPDGDTSVKGILSRDIDRKGDSSGTRKVSGHTVLSDTASWTWKPSVNYTFVKFYKSDWTH